MSAFLFRPMKNFFFFQCKIKVGKIAMLVSYNNLKKASLHMCKCLCARIIVARYTWARYYGAGV